MSINNVNNGGPKTPLDNQRLSQQQQATANGNAQQADTQKSNSAARPDSVSLTSSAQQLISQVQKKGAEAPVNQEKVERLKKAIQNGEYQINPETMAKKISALEAEIFGTKA